MAFLPLRRRWPVARLSRKSSARASILAARCTRSWSCRQAAASNLSCSSARPRAPARRGVVAHHGPPTRRRWAAVLADGTNVQPIQVKTPDRTMESCSTVGCSIRRGLPGLGALRLLSGGWRLWFSRPTPGRHRARPVPPGADARASAARGGAAIRRGRRPTLVATAFRPGGAHAHYRRSRLAGLRGRATMSRPRGTFRFSTR